MFTKKFAALILALLALCAGLPLSAEDGLDDARERREEIARESAEKAAELDLLAAEDQEIVDALAELDTYIGIQEAILADAEQELTSKLEQVETARSQANLLDQQILALEQDIVTRSVETYIGGRSSNATVLSTEDINDAAVMRFLAEDVNGITTDMTDLLRLAKDQQQQALQAAFDSAQDAEGLRDSITAQLADLQISRSAQSQLKAEVEARINELESDTAALQAEDQSIAAFILGEENRRAAVLAAEEVRIEQEKQAADQARQAAEEEERKRRAAEEEDARRASEEEDTPVQPTTQPTSVPTPTPNVVLPVDPGSGQVDPGETPTFIWPNNGPVVSPYGNRVHPVYGTVRFHAGVDIDAPFADPVWASAPGDVIFAGWRDGYGWTVIIEHGNGFSSLYAHLSTILAVEGQPIKTGTHLGLVGSTGTATGDHVHFEIRVNGHTIDPWPLLP